MDSGRSLHKFLAYAGDAPYRELIQEHIQKTSKKNLRLASVQEMSVLANELIVNGEAVELKGLTFNEKALEFIDLLNEQLLPDKDFFQLSSCTDAAEAILRLANQHFGFSFPVPLGSALTDADEVVAFRLFQIATLSFAYTAVDQPKAQKHMGIKSKPWYSFWLLGVVFVNVPGIMLG